jgi:heme oxygenase (biliverdin-IX-beta and delta-forming)
VHCRKVAESVLPRNQAKRAIYSETALMNMHRAGFACALSGMSDHASFVAIWPQTTILGEKGRGEPAMSAIGNLKAATWPIHVRMEKRLAVKRLLSDLAEYRELIVRLDAFHKAAEMKWATLLEQALPDFPARRKAQLLASVLKAVGGQPMTGAEVPTVTDVASALGAFYVLEGQTQGGQHLLPLLETRLGLSASCGASFFASYGSDVGAMWQVFAAALETHCNTSEANRSAVAAAVSTFLTMEAWLCEGR